MSELERLARQGVLLALDQGATNAECTIAEGEQLSLRVRMHALEQIEEAIRRGAGIRVLKGNRAGSATTNDMSAEGVSRMVGCALDLARIASEDPFAGLPGPGDLARCSDDLGIYSKDVTELNTEERVALARAAEEAALQLDPRMVGSEGATFGAYVGHHVFANSLEFCRSYRTTNCSLSVSAVARQNDGMQRDYYCSSSRSAAGLESPEDVGRAAAGRALRRLNPRRIVTQKAPVIFEPRAAGSLVGHLFNAVNGSNICRGMSFLGGRLGKKIASELLTLIDDSQIPGLLGTSPFDDEGVRGGRTIVIENGVLNSYLLNTYSARRLGLKTTGNAKRGLAGSACVGHGNLFITGPRPPAGHDSSGIAGFRQAATDEFPPSLPPGLPDSLLVTGLVGRGVNTTTGDYSQGAVGFWVENAEIAYPVSDIVISGKLQQMLMDIEWIGSDLAFRSSLASPTLLVGRMIVAGR